LLGVIALLAALVRVLNLGTFSMWLDEILQTLQAELPWRDMIGSLRGDFVHPPLDAALTKLQLALGVGETGRRFLPIALGVATVVVLTAYCRRRFGGVAAVATGLLAAFSPFHIQYSQELRPYSLGLTLAVLALYASEKWLAEGRRRWLVATWISLCLASLSLYVASLLVLPMLARAADRVGLVAWFRRAAVLAAALVPLAAWVAFAAAGRQESAWPGPPGWGWPLAARRLERLLYQGLETSPLRPLLLVGVLSVLVFGCSWALRRHRDVSLLVGAVAGGIGVEALLLAAGHWSNPRYDIIAWPFLLCLLGLGVSAVTTGARSPAGTPVAVLLVGAILAAQLVGLTDYYRRGRPDWAWMATGATRLTALGGVVYAGGDWSHVCLSYYLRSSAVPLLQVGSSSPADIVQRSARECVYVVEGGYGRRPSRWRRFPRVQRDPGGQGAELFRLSEPRDGLSCVWTTPYTLRRRQGFASPWWREPAGRMEMGRFAEPHLLAGWLAPEAGEDGTRFVWATGPTALLALGGGEPKGEALEIVVHASPPGQVVSLRHNGAPVGRYRVDRVPTRIRTPLAGPWGEENVVELRFAKQLVPREAFAGAAEPRRLALAVSSLVVEYAGPSSSETDRSEASDS
jgi:hypothetical protein